jgi:hypothetical protein
MTSIFSPEGAAMNPAARLHGNLTELALCKDASCALIVNNLFARAQSKSAE